MHDVERFLTDRMAARRICAGDFEDIFRLHTDPRVVATLGGPRSDEQTREYLQACLVHWDQYGWGQWIFEQRMLDDRGMLDERGRLDERAAGPLVGRCGLRHYAVSGADVGPDAIELLYAVRAEYWGRGLATEMARAVLRLAFEQLGLESVVAFTLPTNLASRRVMEKAGMRYDRDITHAHRPHVLYRAVCGGVA
jgi:RimJ/RimL family protein N-acetyltransferase